MGRLADRMRDLEISVSSRDETVTLRVTGGGQLDLELSDDCLDVHGEESLARTVEGVIRVAIAAGQQAQRQVIDSLSERAAP